MIFALNYTSEGLYKQFTGTDEEIRDKIKELELKNEVPYDTDPEEMREDHDYTITCA